MVKIVLGEGPVYKAPDFLDYKLPHEAKGDVEEIKKRVSLDGIFANIICNEEKYGAPFAAHLNHFYHKFRPLPEWKWSNTPESVRKVILDGLRNQALLAISQKTRLLQKFPFIKDKNERSRVLKECNDQLVHIWNLLNAFKCFDNRIMELQIESNTEWMIDPDINIPIETKVDPPVTAGVA